LLGENLFAPCFSVWPAPLKNETRGIADQHWFRRHLSKLNRQLTFCEPEIKNKF
jgi:hypothetical protein